MEDALLNFSNQFSYKPVIVNGDIPQAKRIVVVGMGGSHLAAHLLRAYDRSIPLMVRSDYGLPEMTDEEKKSTLFIMSSYSGNTEEVVSSLELALEERVSLAVISTGGRLIEIAEEKKVPYIQLPQTGIQPRTAVPYALIALAKVIGRDDVIETLRALERAFDQEQLRAEGQELAEGLRGHIPVIYSSTRNRAIAYNWKIKFNETSKIPAFYNVFPELNHNEMTGFDVVTETKSLSENLRFVFLKDRDDNLRVQKRMDICEKLYQERGLEVISKEFTGGSRFEKIFQSILLADWTALALSNMYGTESEQVPMVEDFKKQL